MCHLYARNRPVMVKSDIDWTITVSSEIPASSLCPRDTRSWVTDFITASFLLCIIHVWLCFPESTISSSNWGELPRNRVPFCQLVVYNRSGVPVYVPALFLWFTHRLQREWRGGSREGIRPVCTVWKQSDKLLQHERDFFSLSVSNQIR